MDANSIEHGYLGPIAGPFTQFDVPGSAGTYPAGSNASGVVVGFWTDAADKVHGFVRNASGTITKFDVSGQAQTQPESINSTGQVAGVAYDSTGAARGFVGTPAGKLTTYSFPTGSIYGSAHLNDAGQIAGYYADRNFASKGYFRDTNGTFTTLTEGGQVGVGDINQGGHIVGVYGGKYHGRKDGYLNRPNGTFATIEYPGASLIVSSTKAIDINTSGLIMGEYQLTTQSGGDGMARVYCQRSSLRSSPTVGIDRFPRAAARPTIRGHCRCCHIDSANPTFRDLSVLSLSDSGNNA
jgi:hypothetical protein